MRCRMRRLTVGLCLAGCAFAAVSGCGPKPAAEEPKKYVVAVHGPEGEAEKTYDLAKADDRQSLFHDLEAGHVHELKREQPPNLFMLERWDLGVWSLLIFFLLF